MKKLLLAVIAVCVFAGTGLAKEKIIVQVYPDLDSHLKKALPLFYEENPDIEVEIVAKKHDDHHNGLVTHLAAGSGAGDVVAVDVGFVGELMAGDGFEDVSKAPYGGEGLKGKFAPYAWAQAHHFDGSLCALPTDLGPGVIYYRRDILKDAGWTIEEATKDWDAFIEYGKELKKKGIHLMGNAADVAELIIHTEVGPGEGRYFDKDGKCLVDTERFKKAFAIAKRIRDLGLDARIKAWTNEWYEGFRNGTFATQMSGAWLLGHLKNWMAPKTAGKWGASNLPGGVYGSWGGSFYAIPVQSEHKEAAWKFIKFLTTRPDIQIAGFENTAAFPALVEVYGDACFAKPIPFLDGQKAGLLFAEAAENIKPVLPGKGDLVARRMIIDSAVHDVLNENRDIDESLAEAKRLIERRVR